MNHFDYRDDALYAENVAIAEIAAAVGTPFYCYSTATLRHHYNALADAMDAVGLGARTMICYSVKANSNLSVITSLAQMGAGADIVSGGELHRALKAGIAPERIVFSGVGKTRTELRAALAAGIWSFNVESIDELELLSAVAQESDKTARVSLRVNPDIDAGTHDKIATGGAETKFGIAWEDAVESFARARALPALEVVGIDVHIGSQITDLAPFRQAFTRIADLYAQLQADGFNITHLDLGGGLGVPYESGNDTPPAPTAYAQAIAETLGDTGCDIILEPGRMIAGNAGVLITSVIRTKLGRACNFMIVDAAMTELLRPTLYDAYHEIKPVLATDAPTKIWDIVGPVCETGDFLGRARELPMLAQGALLAVFTTGAYGAVLGSSYNSRPPAPEVLVAGDQFAITRARPNFDDMMRDEKIPDWLGAEAL